MTTNKNKAKIALLTRTIKASWKKSVESLIEIGRCLHELKKLLDRPEYIEHLSSQLSISEMQASRLEQLYLKFHDKKSIHVLSSKPSVLYLIASSVEPKKVEALARGNKVLISGSLKSISQFTMKDVIALSEKASKRNKSVEEDDLEDDEYDLRRAENAHRRLATLVEELNDWSLDLLRFNEQRIEIKNKSFIKQYIKESIECLVKLDRLLT
jgi:hypothetical protein